MRRRRPGTALLGQICVGQDGQQHVLDLLTELGVQTLRPKNPDRKSRAGCVQNFRVTIGRAHACRSLQSTVEERGQAREKTLRCRLGLRRVWIRKAGRYDRRF